MPSPAHFKALAAKTIAEQLKGMSEFELSCTELEGFTLEKRIANDRAEWLNQSACGKTIVLSSPYYQGRRDMYSDATPLQNVLDYDHAAVANQARIGAKFERALDLSNLSWPNREPLRQWVEDQRRPVTEKAPPPNQSETTNTLKNIMNSVRP